MDPISEKNLITTKDAGELSGYSPDYLARLARSEKIAGRRIGHSWFIDKESLANFLNRQEIHKTDYARTLARKREIEYRRRHSFVHSIEKTLSKSLPMPSLNIKENVLRSQAIALSVALFVVASSAYVANAAPSSQFFAKAAAISREVAFGFNATFGDIPSRIASRINSVSEDLSTYPVRIAVRSEIASAKIIPTILIDPDLSSVRMILADDHQVRLASQSESEVSKVQVSVEPMLTIGDIRSFISDTSACIMHPSLIADAFVNSYLAIGVDAYDALNASLLGYRSMIMHSGIKTLAFAATARDTFSVLPSVSQRIIDQANLGFGTAIIGATHTAIRTDVAAAYGLSAAAPASARVAVALIGNIGDVVANTTEHLAVRTPTTLALALRSFSEAGPRIAQTIFNAEYASVSPFVAFADTASENYLKAIAVSGRLAYSLYTVGESGYAGTLAFAHTASPLLVDTPAILEDAYLGVLGKTALALDTIARVPKVATALSALHSATQPMLAAVAPTLSAGEQVALVTYKTITDFFDSANRVLATLIGPSPTIVMPTISTQSTSKDALPTAYSLLPATNNSYPTYTTLVKGISEDFMNQSLASLRSDILATVAGMIQPVSNQVATNVTTIQQVNMIQKLDGLIVTNGDFRGGTFSNGNVTDGISVSATTGSFTDLTVSSTTITTLTAGATALATTTITGDLAVSGIITPSIVSASSYISAPYFTATSTTATSTFAGSLAIGTTSPWGNGIFTVGTSSPLLHISSNTGYVGIGTTTPNNLLSVYDLIDFNNTDFNTKIGYQSGKNIVTGAQYNTFLGYQAGFASSTASTNAAVWNSAIGYQSLYSNTRGAYNSTIGYQSLYSNTTGSNNSAAGMKALYSNTTGASNTAVGDSSLFYNTTGSYNSALGMYALKSNTIGSSNVAIGYGALNSNTTGSSNVAIGYISLYYNLSATSTIAIGEGAARGTSNYSNQFGTYVGYRSGYSVQTNSNNNSFFGYKSGYANTTGANNLFLGYQAGDNVTTGSNNIVIGYDLDAPSATASNQLNIGGLIYGDTSTGLMGIGTTSPYSLLSISNSATTAVNTPLFTIASTTAGTSTTTLMTILANGNVGIGTTSPESTLSVDGDGYFTGNLLASGTTGLTLNGSGSSITFTGAGDHDITATAGTLRIGSNTIIGNIQALNNTVDIGTPDTHFDIIYANEVNATTLVGTISAGNVSAETLTINSDNIVTNDLENSFLVFTRGSQLGAHLKWNADTSAKRFEFNQPIYIQDASLTSATSTLLVQGWSGQTSDIFRVASSSSENNSYFNVTSAGNVGIGTTTPNNLLSVYDLIDFNNTDFNTKLGYQAGKYVVTGANNNTYIGYQAGSADNATGKTSGADSNTAVGYQTLYKNTTGQMNTAMGQQSLFTNTTGQSNVAIGVNTLYSNTTGRYNTAIGNTALYSNSVGWGNTAVGYYSLFSNLGYYNVGLGHYAGMYETGDNSFYVNNIDEGSTANDKNYSLLYGTFSGVAGSLAGQKLVINGNVGIGTTTPYSRLSVWGAGTGATSLFELTNSASTTLASVLNDGTFYMKGNVGIGTTTPAALLALQSKSSGLSFYLAGNSLNTSNLFSISTSTASATTTALTINQNGDLSLLNGANLTVGGNLTVTGTTAYTGLSTFTIASTSQLSVFNNAYFGGTATSTFDSAGNLSVAGTLAVTGNTTLGTLTGLIAGNSGSIYQTATSTPTLGLGLSYSGTLGSLVGGASGSLTIATSSLYSGAANALPYFTDTNTLGSINAGTNGFVLAMSGGVPTWLATTSIPVGGDMGGTLSNLSINDAAVTYAKLQNLGYGEIIGRNTAGAGVSTGLSTSTYKSMLALTASDVGLGNVANTAQVTAVTGTWPIISSLGTTPNITWGGLATSTDAVVGNIPYFSGANTFANIATSTPTLGLGLSYSGTLGSLVGGASGSLTIATSSLYSGAANALPYFTSTNTLGSINAGTNGFILAMSGGVPTWLATTSIPVGGNISGTLSNLTVVTNANLSGDVSSVGNTTTIGANKVTVGMLAQAAANTLLGNDTGVAGNITAISTSTLNIGGNAGTATALQTARTINGVSFNGTANITIASTTLLANNNTWSGTNTFSTLPTLGTLTGLIAGNSGSLYQTATSTPTFSLGLTSGGTWNVLGSSPTLAIATSSLYSGTTGQFPYFSGTNTLTATSSIFLALSGNIGIGTDNPDRALEINNATGGALRLTYNDSDGSAANYSDLTVDSDGALIITPSNNATTTIANGLVVNTDSLVVQKATGNVGIGTIALSAVKFAVALAAASVADAFTDLGRIAILNGIVESSGQISLTQVACGSYTVIGLDGLTYGTVLGEDGECWLDRNLGATNVATGYNDSTNYGDYYQWGRTRDGHQISTSSVAPFSDVITTSIAVSAPYASYFVATTTTPYDWLNQQNNNLWGDANRTNNVCPSGWHVPTQTEWATWTNSAGLTTGAGTGSNGTTLCGSGCLAAAYNTNLKLPTAGTRNRTSGALSSQGSYGGYWSSSPSGTSASNLDFYSTAVYPADTTNRAYGFSVRCVQGL